MWTLLQAPGWLVAPPPVWMHRGWTCFGPNQMPVWASGGFAVDVGEATVFAPNVLYIETDYDFEYRNRMLCGPSVVHGN